MKVSINFLTIVLALLVACGKKKEQPTEDNVSTEQIEKPRAAMATIESRSDSNVSGTVYFSESKGIVSMKANISGLTEGNHAIHIHAVGDCSAPDGKSAGGHWNPTNEDHGKWQIPPFHKGDIGNIVADAEGKGEISRETNLWCIGCSDESKNVVGKAIIIHTGPDDFSSQPSGAAGTRIGCGEIVEQAME